VLPFTLLSQLWLRNSNAGDEETGDREVKRVLYDHKGSGRTWIWIQTWLIPKPPLSGSLWFENQGPFSVVWLRSVAFTGLSGLDWLTLSAENSLHVWMVGQPTFTEQGIRLPQEMGPEAVSRSELGKCLQFQLLRRPEQEDPSLKLAWVT
jgi:hypothetical protein